MQENSAKAFTPFYWFNLFLGPLLALLVITFADLVPGRPEATAMAGITLWMAWWWLSEAVHLAVTSLLPLILFPLLLVAPAKDTAQQYMDNIIFLFIGGFLLAFAIERWHLHRRIALRILLAVGTKPSRILLGVLLTTYFCSMWISNTATVMMLLSAVYAVIHQVEEHIGDKEQHRKFSTALLIGLAYSATIGGMATLVGTPTNMIFYQSYQKAFPESTEMNFMSWAVIGIPVSLLMLLVAYVLLKWLFIPRGLQIGIDKTFFREAYRQLGPMRYEEKIVGIVFALTALLWFTRSEIDFGSFAFPGWASLFPEKYKDYAQDSTVAILMAVLLFLMPSRNERGKNLINWDDAKKLPFDIILLFGGGFALAYGIDRSGLSVWMAGRLEFMQDANIVVLIAGLCLIVTIISEFASNVASIQLVLPILLALHKELHVHPLVLMIPATLAASLGFMLPVATAPNTIVYGSKRFRAAEMMKVGWWMDVIGIVVITAICVLFVS